MARNTSTTTLLALALAAGSVSSVAKAQTWAAPASGLWFNALNWNPQAVPTGAGATATLGLSGPYTVTTAGNTLLGVDITNPAALLAIQHGQALSLGSATNILNGVLMVNDTGSYNGTNLDVGTSTVAFNGTGTLRLNASTSDGNTTSNTAAVVGSGSMTMGAGTKVAGFGRVIGISTTNNGTFTADVAGRPLLVQNGTHQNNGLYTAANGGALVLDGDTITQSGSGSMAPASGSSVQISNTSVTGGSLVSLPDARVQVNQGTSAALNALSIVGGLDIYHSSGTTIGPAGINFVGGATMLVNATANYAGTHVYFQNGTTQLSGNGTLRLNASTSDGSTTALTAELRQDGSSPGGTMSVQPAVTVAGFGMVNGLSTANGGTMNADVSGRPLRVENAAVANNAVMEATNGGVLLINGGSVTQAPGGSIGAYGSDASSNPSSAQLSNTSVSGGFIVSSGAARSQVNPGTSATLAGVTINGGLDTYNSSITHVNNPGVTLAGGATLLINTTGNYAGTSLRAGDPGTAIGGNGTVRLNSSTSDGQTSAQTGTLLADTDTASFTFGSGVTLAGFGGVYNVPTTNNGMFSADIPGRPLRIQGSTHQNNNQYRSSNGGYLWLTQTGVTQAGGASIMAGQDSGVTLSGSTITGGTIGSAAGSNGLVNTDNSTCSLENVNVSRQLSIDPSGTLVSASTVTLTNNAVLTVNTNSAYAGTRMRADGAPTTIAGTGTVHLSASTSDGSTTAGTADLARNTSVDGAGFTFGPGITVDGFGRISDCPTTNNGVVSANVSGRLIRIDSNTHQNNHRYESRNGGSLVMVNSTVTQSPAGVVNAGDGSDLELSSATLLGGTFSGDGSGAGFINGSSTLGANLTLNAPMNVNAGQALYIDAQGITNNSVITVNTNAAYSGTVAYAGAPTTPINGTGEVRLNKSSSDGSATASTAAVRAGAAGNAFIFGAGQSLTGSGSIECPITMNGAIAPGFGAGNVSFIRNTGNVTMTGTGRMLIDIASPGSFDSIVNPGTLSVGGTLSVASQYDAPPGATFDIVNGGTVNGHFNAVLSSGLTSPKRFGARVDPGRVRVTVLCGAADIAGAGADGNGDGVLDNNDFIVFINRFFAQDPRADFGSAGGFVGSDGAFDNNDFIAFITLFFAGCF